MTFGSREASIQDSQPVEIYEILIGTEAFRWTSAEQDVVISGVTYEAVPIERTQTFAGPETRENLFEVRVPSTNTFARKYVTIIPADQAAITVTRYQRLEGTTDVVQIFEGVVQSVAFERNGAIAVIGCQPVIAGLSRPVPRYTYSSGCNHVLYDPLTCRVARSGTAPGGEAYRVTAAVTGVSGSDSSILTIPGAAALPDGWFDSGEITIQGDARLVLRHVGDQVRILVGFPFALLGQEVTIFAGCAHDPNACTLKFANYPNYGGSPDGPDRNPFRVGLS